MDKDDVVHGYNGISLSHEKRQIPTICSDVDGPGGTMLSEISPPEKDKLDMVSFLWGNIKTSEREQRGWRK